VNNIARDGCGGFAKHVGDDSIESDFADGEHVLIAVFLAGFTGYQFETVARKFAQDPGVPIRDKTAGNQTEAKQIADPLRILGIILVALYCPNPFGVSDGDVDGIFKQIIYGNIVFPGGFHTDIAAIVLQQPLFERENLIVERGKSPLLIVRDKTFRSDKRGDKESLVDIDTTTDGINDIPDFQETPSPI